MEKFAKFSLLRYRVVAKVEEAFLPLFIKIKEPGRFFYFMLRGIVAAVANRGQPISRGANDTGDDTHRQA